MTTTSRPRATAEAPAGDQPLVVPLAALDRHDLALAGGKAANLGEMIGAGLPVPPGFCVTTAAYAQVADAAGLAPLLDELAGVPATEIERLGTLAEAVRARLLAAPLPPEIAASVTAAYQALGDAVPVAVRSSATAEDLPFASFAGQQETYLNVVGAAALLEAVQRCWASLWTHRAVSYRASAGIAQRGVRLAVAVQRLMPAQVAGILFTANPVTGRRRQAVIDASPGLGEAVVSGAVNPDRFVVETATGRIVEQRLGSKTLAIEPAAGGGTRRVERVATAAAPCLTPAQVATLAALGARVEAHYGAPQDIEWALDPAGTLWLTQARPITTLFPLPADAPTDERDLCVYFSGSVAQGVYQPLTPMGLQAFRLLAGAIGELTGNPPRDRWAGPSTVVEAGQRLFLDITPLLRTALGARIASAATSIMEARTHALLDDLLTDPRLAPRPVRRGPFLRGLLRLLWGQRVAPLALLTVVRPAAMRRRIARQIARMRTAGARPVGDDPAARLREAERLVRLVPPSLIKITPALLVGIGAARVAERLLGDLATPDERQRVLRGLPHNPTTEMDLALWALAKRAQADPAAVAALRAAAPAALTRQYQVGALPPALQDGLASFLATYGHRAVAEIDLGVPRWAEDPTHLLGALVNYLDLTDPALAPDAQFERAAGEARALATTLQRRAASRGRLRGWLVGLCLRRARELGGLREMPKFGAVLLFAQARAHLRAAGTALAATGRLAAPDDIFFLTLAEAHAAAAGVDQRALVAERQASFAQEMRRRHVPRLLLSDGTEPEALAAAATDGDLRGTPASPGQVTGIARVILDPIGARLQPGEILVAPSTDPGWTPLFLTAGGLVMEMGGAMSHGAVVAREYGIPAVVGVPDATQRIADGARITVDGTAGAIVHVEE